MTDRSKANKYARRVLTDGNPLSKSEYEALMLFGTRRQHREPATGKRAKHRASIQGPIPKQKVYARR